MSLKLLRPESYFRVARKPTMAELQKTSLVKYFASLSLKLGVSFVGGCSAYRWNCWRSWQASPGVPSLDTAGVRERAMGGLGAPHMENVSWVLF